MSRDALSMQEAVEMLGDLTAEDVAEMRSYQGADRIRNAVILTETKYWRIIQTLEHLMAGDADALREGIAAYVAELREDAYDAGAGSVEVRCHLGRVADELERRFLQPPTTPLPVEQVPAFEAWQEVTRTPENRCWWEMYAPVEVKAEE